MRRRDFIISAGLLAPGALLAGCDALGLGTEPQTTVVLIDRSGSVAPADREIYVTSLNALASQLDGGDRLLVAEVGDAGRSGFRALLDITVEQSNVRLDREDAIRNIRRRIVRAIPELLPEDAAGQARETRIVETIAAAAQAFGLPPRAGSRLVLLSDAVEESLIAQLDRDADADARAAAIDRARRAGMLPDLREVQLIMVGAGGAHYADVEAFWRAYAVATGARITAYGRLPYRPGA